MQYRLLPFEHLFEILKNDPTKALYPQAQFNPQRATWRFWLMVPVIFFKLFRSALRLRRLGRTFAQKFREEIIPPFVAETNQEAKTDLSKEDSAKLLEKFQYWVRRTLYDFARDSLKPTVLAAISMSNLERTLARLETNNPEGRLPGQEPPFTETVDKARAKLRQLMMGVKLEPEADLPGAIRALSRSEISHDEFLERFGHRGSLEMELANPRWSEDSSQLDRLVRSGESSPGTEREPRVDGSEKDPFAEYKLSAGQRKAMEEEMHQLQVFLSLRESAKHHLMRGYALIRRYLRELDSRYQLQGGIFYLTPGKLPDLLAGKDYADLIAERKRRHELLTRLPVPQVLFSDNLEALGRQEDLGAQHSLQGIPLSAGVAEGPALVLAELPEEMPGEESFILVCPSTDPAWMPLFLRARAVVMETGGMLSHGAIVAREFGLPAVAGLPNIHRQLRSGQRLQVDGSTGKVNVLV